MTGANWSIALLLCVSVCCWKAQYAFPVAASNSSDEDPGSETQFENEEIAIGIEEVAIENELQAAAESETDNFPDEPISKHTKKLTSRIREAYTNFRGFQAAFDPMGIQLYWQPTVSEKEAVDITITVAIRFFLLMDFLLGAILVAQIYWYLRLRATLIRFRFP